MEHSSNFAQPWRRKYTHLLFTLFLVIVVSLASWIGKESDVKLDWSDTGVLAADPDGNVYTVSYADVTSVQLMECGDFGRCISGQQTKTCICGTWKNELWGEYQICADPRVGLSIVFRTSENLFVLNYESNETTAALYDSILQIPTLQSEREDMDRLVLAGG